MRYAWYICNNHSKDLFSFILHISYRSVETSAPTSSFRDFGYGICSGRETTGRPSLGSSVLQPVNNTGVVHSSLAGSRPMAPPQCKKARTWGRMLGEQHHLCFSSCQRGRRKLVFLGMPFSSILFPFTHPRKHRIREHRVSDLDSPPRPHLQMGELKQREGWGLAQPPQTTPC